MYKLLLPYDVYERHKKVASFINGSGTVVDIGGELNHLSQFIHPEKLIVANLTGGDVIIPRDKLPFDKSSFDIVCAIDVFEHIPKTNRAHFVNSLLKTASKKVIMSFPIATARHIQYEKETLESLKVKGQNVEYLDEHIRFGLPTNEEIGKLTQDLNVETYYSGNITINKILFRIFMIDPQIKFIRKLVYILKLIFNLLTNQILYLLLVNKRYSESVNRAYLVIHKN